MIGLQLSNCIFQQNSRKTCSDSLVTALWNKNSVKWFSVDSVSNAGGILVLSNESTFKVDSIEYGGQWLGLFGLHVQLDLKYAGSSIAERRILWEELLILQSAFEIPLFLGGDSNETLNQNDRSSRCMNEVGSRDFSSFHSSSDLLEYPLSGHRYTRFSGHSISCVDRAFASPECHLKFSMLTLTRRSRGLSDHCQMMLGVQNQDWGWKPFNLVL
ncbi:PREDICTED: uncharacterized protein LOC105142186 [Populus euphratica]|uniref:Uncharacterized protein LOC105142186 n=1 Tax=Populus euphratica TaxID=75702 RepID=A0AAJ6VID6_POPEU|nr:PREDICTED: uncharacterized protein LOC105142186 [Populus euphratica]